MRRLRRPDDGESRRPSRHPSGEADRALQSERARFAANLDAELRLACRSEAAMRRELGCAARAFVHRRAYRRLGFVRLSDYARERLGVSARTLQSAAWLASRLDALPAVSRAYDRSELSWAQARAICRVAVAADEERWLALARASTVETLERAVVRVRQPDGVAPDPDAEPSEIDGEPAVRWRFACPARVRGLWRRALELASRAAGEPLSEWRAAEIVAAEGSSGRPPGASLGERALLAALRIARRARHGGRRAGENGPTRAGDDAPSAALVECPGNDVERSLAADAGGVAGQSVLAGAGIPDGERRGAAGLAPLRAGDAVPAGAAIPEPLACERRASGDPLVLEPPPASGDPFDLDARLVEAMRVLRTIEPRIGRLLRVMVDHRFHRTFGHAAFDGYVRERLGISVRKAWALLEIEKATLRSDDFGRAYREGRLSWVRALALLPVLDRQHAPAWIARAEGVTVRRLNDEVEWVLAARDALGSSVSLAPPPVDSRLPPVHSTLPPGDSPLPSFDGLLSSPLLVAWPGDGRNVSPDARLQIRAPAAGSEVAGAGAEGDARGASPDAWADARNRHSVSTRGKTLDVRDAEIRFTGPASVVALLRDVLDAFAEPGEPRWIGLERLLRHVITYWESTPRHPDPVFARDGWRCTVPACTSRRNLHDHHIRFRSRGGDNRRENRTTVCAAHHLHGLHDGTLHAGGVAPHAIEWRLGVRPGAPPFLTFVGDRYGAAAVAHPAAGDPAAAALP